MINVLRISCLLNGSACIHHTSNSCMFCHCNWVVQYSSRPWTLHFGDHCVLCIYNTNPAANAIVMNSSFRDKQLYRINLLPLPSQSSILVWLTWDKLFCFFFRLNTLYGRMYRSKSFPVGSAWFKCTSCRLPEHSEAAFCYSGFISWDARSAIVQKSQIGSSRSTTEWSWRDLEES